MTLVRLLSICSVLLVGGMLTFLAGCDSGTSKRAAQSQQLSGLWEVQSVRVGTIEYRRLDVQFDVAEGEGVKSYRLVRTGSEDTTVVRGEIRVIRSNTIRMNGEFSTSPLVWTFDFSRPDDLESSVRFSLQSALEESADAFLDVLGVSGGPGPIEMDLVRPS